MPPFLGRWIFFLRKLDLNEGLNNKSAGLGAGCLVSGTDSLTNPLCHCSGGFLPRNSNCYDDDTVLLVMYLERCKDVKLLLLTVL